MTQKFNNDIVQALPVSFEVKANASGHIQGYASMIGNVDRHGEVVLRGAFTKSLARQKAAGEMPVMLWAHAQEQPIGKWSAMQEDGKGLFVEGKLNLKTSMGREAYEHVKAGDLGGLSIGFTIPEGGRKYEAEGIYSISQIDLMEVSIVAIPANPLARITTVKSLQSKSEAIEMLRECGLSKAAAAKFAAGGFKALGNDETHEKSIQLASIMDAAIKKMRAL